MNSALDNKNQLHYAIQLNYERDREKLWLCPICRQKVILKRSRYQHLYFSHYRLACNNTKESPFTSTSISESEQHKKGKQLLKRQFPQSLFKVEEEFYFSQTHQYADLFVIHKDSGKATIYEFQHSIIPSDIIQQRHQDYSQFVDQVYWFGDSTKFGNQPFNTLWSNTLTCFDAQLGYYIPVINLEREAIQLWSQIPVIYHKNDTKYVQHQVDIASGTILSTQPIVNQLLEQGSQNVATYYKQLNMVKRNKAYYPMLKTLYQLQMPLEQLPVRLFEQPWQLTFLQTPIWFVTALLIKDQITFDSLEQSTCIQQFRDHPLLSWNATPFIQEERIIYDTLKAILCLIQ